MLYVDAVEEALCFGWIDSLINHGFQDKAQKQLQNVIKYAKLGRYYGQWNDNGRLLS